MTITQPDLRAAADGVWQTMLGMQLQDPAPEACPDGDLMFACVQLSGAWAGTVQLSCTRAFARVSAAAMLQMDAAELGDAEIGDALGELANMVGGGIKAKLPAPTQLSPPIVVAGQNISMSVQNSRRIDRSLLCHDGELLAISLYQNA